MTGYVIKSYSEAYNFIGDIIDKDSVVRSVNFLLAQQNKAGEYQENYRGGNPFLKVSIFISLLPDLLINCNVMSYTHVDK